MTSAWANTKFIAAAVAIFCAGGCASTRHPPTTYHGTPGAPAVFVADGAGNFQAASEAVRKAAERGKMKLDVLTFNWSHGYCRILADQLCFGHAREQGKRLAEEVKAFSVQHPDVPVYLVGHSAGATVVLSALENLPPHIVERAMLLSPSISARYDVRPALRNVKLGMHVYTSRHDFYYLGLATHVLGTADRRFFEAAAGRTGFHVDPTSDLDLMLKLHQRAWQPSDGVTGNLGGHFGNYQPEFLRHNLLPLISPVKS